jgi:phosphoesterase RecJ-like protein
VGTANRHQTDVATAARLLRAATDVTLLGHVNPDADAFGSAVGLGLALQAAGARVLVSFGAPATVPQSLRGLDCAGLFVPAEQVPAVPAALVVLDSSSVDRLGQLADRVDAVRAAGGPVIVIDHHVSNTLFGTLNVVDETAPATAAVVLRVLDELGAPLTEPVARALYAGLLTDTSSFRRATPDVLRTAARLLDTGVDADAVARPLLDAHPFGWLRLVSDVLGRAVLEPDAAGGLGMVHATVRTADLDGLRPEDVESLVGFLASVDGPEVAVLLKQAEPTRWAVSLRSVGRVDVSVVARAFGGGGHRRAAGFSAAGTAPEVLARLRSSLDGNG